MKPLRVGTSSTEPAKARYPPGGASLTARRRGIKSRRRVFHLLLEPIARRRPSRGTWRRRGATGRDSLPLPRRHRPLPRPQAPKEVRCSAMLCGAKGLTPPAEEPPAAGPASVAGRPAPCPWRLESAVWPRWLSVRPVGPPPVVLKRRRCARFLQGPYQRRAWGPSSCHPPLPAPGRRNHLDGPGVPQCWRPPGGAPPVCGSRRARPRPPERVSVRRPEQSGPLPG